MLASPSTPSSTDTLQGIRSAFFAALDRDGGPVFAVALGLVVVILAGLLFAWLRRKIRDERADQAALDARHQAAAQATRCEERRRRVRVPAHVPMRLRRADARGRVGYEPCETLNISGDAVAFLSRTSPTNGLPVDFTIDLGEERQVPLRGVVHRVEAPCTPDAPAFVVVKLGPLSPAESAQLTRWVAHEEERRLAEKSRGPLCSACRRPLATDTDLVHPACAAAKSVGRAVALSTHPPRPRAHRRVLRDTLLRGAPASARRPS